jgi:hypothetical protein
VAGDAGGSTLADCTGCVVADCAIQAQVIPTVKADSVMAFRKSRLISTSLIAVEKRIVSQII